MNVCCFVGKLIKEPEIRYLSSGVATCSFAISVYPFAQGEYKSDLVNIVAWRKQAEWASENLRKGSMVSIEARYSPRSYDNNEGRKVHIHEFTANNIRSLERGERQEQRDPFQDDGKPIDISDDDLPF
jgi:single-strand DNA-binding protein